METCYCLFLLNQGSSTLKLIVQLKECFHNKSSVSLPKKKNWYHVRWNKTPFKLVVLMRMSQFSYKVA